MKYTIRIKNDMFGWERNQTMQVDADSEAEALAAGRNVDRFASITVEKVEEPAMDYDEIDCLVVKELKSVARSLVDTIVLEDIDYDDSLHTLKATLEVISYYSTANEYVNFVSTLPEQVLEALVTDAQENRFEERNDGIDVATASNSDLAYNLKNLGFKTYMVMAKLGFITFAELITAATVQLKSNASKHN